MDSDEKLLERATRLLALAEGTDSEAERESAMRQYSFLVNKHSLDQEMVRARKEGEAYRASAPTIVTYTVGTKGERGQGAYAELLSQIAIASGLRTVLSNSEVTVVGPANEIKYAYDLYLRLIGNMVSETIAYLETEEYRRHGHTKLQARKSFMYGYAIAIYYRVKEERERAEREALSTERGVAALVIRNKKKAINELYESEFGRLGTRKLPSYWNAHSRKGEAAAYRASLKDASGVIGD